MIRSTISLLQALFFLISACAVPDSNFKERVDWAAIGVTGRTNISFDAITADELAVTDAEKALCRDWFERHVVYAGANGTSPAYELTVDGRSLQKHPEDWSFTAAAPVEGVRRGGSTYYIDLKHKKSGLTARVEATLYEAYATCEWTVYVTNAGNENSPTIKRFSGFDGTLETGVSMVYTGKGSGADANDFELRRAPVNVLPMRFTANGGRSESFLPYFNITGRNLSVVMTVGWTGEWITTLSQTVKGVKCRAAQRLFSAYLTPGETVRSPLVSLSFYQSRNALKGFNLLRRWTRDCVYTESAREITTTGLAGEFSRETADQMIDSIGRMPQELCDKVDFLWMDAGWYPWNTNWYDSVGNWYPDPARFPDGLRPVSDAAKARGMGLLLWFEPERCCAGTQVYEECAKHPGWLLTRDENVNMVNLAEDGACDYLGNLVAQAIRTNGVGLYRQDFNFTPLPLWQEADKTLYGGRKGIAENHYVTNLYRYLDTLLAVNPGLIIDNCASGGKRLDIEMSRRSVPLWRNDYNCADETGARKPDLLEATQVNTYGLSAWLPLHGTGTGLPGEYADRSGILPCAQQPGYEDVRQYLTKNYFPLAYGGMNEKKLLAMQFGDEASGCALIYRREKVKDDSWQLRLNGLDPQTTYAVSDYDAPGQVKTMTGEALMTEGLSVPFTEAPKCAIVLYKAAG